MKNLILSIFLVLVLAMPSWAGMVIGSGQPPASGTTETFDKTVGYDLTWVETVPAGNTIDEDYTTTTYNSSPQSLHITHTLGNSAESKTVYDIAGAGTTKTISFWLYIDSDTVVSDKIYIATIGDVTSWYDHRAGLTLYLLLDTTMKIRIRGSGYSTSTFDIVTDAWREVKIDYVQNGNSTLTYNGSSTTAATYDIGADDLALGFLVDADTTEVLDMVIDEVEIK